MEKRCREAGTVNPETSRTARERNEDVLIPSKRVLVVEDDALMRELLGELLQDWSFAPSLTASVREAQDAVLTEKPFTVIVSDYHLADGNGLGILDWLRREMQIPVPFLLISGEMTLASVVADDYEILAKPFRLQEFRNCLEKLGGLKFQRAYPLGGSSGG
jgi:DNA-binding NtrC family response regulator